MIILPREKNALSRMIFKIMGSGTLKILRMAKGKVALSTNLKSCLHLLL